MTVRAREIRILADHLRSYGLRTSTPVITHFNLSPTVLPLKFPFFCLGAWDEEPEPHVCLFFFRQNFPLFSLAQKDPVTFHCATSRLKSEHFFDCTVFTHEGKTPRHMPHWRRTICLDTSSPRGPVKSPETCRIWQLFPDPASGASTFQRAISPYLKAGEYRPENECTLLLLLFFFFLRYFLPRTPALTTAAFFVVFFALNGITRTVIQRP